jgi:hypothetical protein
MVDMLLIIEMVKFTRNEIIPKGIMMENGKNIWRMDRPSLFRFIPISNWMEKYEHIKLIKESKEPTASTYNFGIVNPNFYQRRVVLTYIISNKEYSIVVERAGYKHGDKKTTWAKVAKGQCNYAIYTVFSKKLIGSYNLKLTNNNQSISLN